MNLFIAIGLNLEQYNLNIENECIICCEIFNNFKLIACKCKNINICVNCFYKIVKNKYYTCPFCKTISYINFIDNTNKIQKINDDIIKNNEFILFIFYCIFYYFLFFIMIYIIEREINNE